MHIKTDQYTVIGAGNGGKAMAAHLALMGLDVKLYNRTLKNIAGIAAQGGIQLEGASSGDIHGFGKLACVTSDLELALSGSKVIMIVVPAFAHSELGCAMSPFLHPGQIVILHPGRTFGAVEFRKALKDTGCSNGVIVAEAQTFIYASRSEGPARARIFRIKDSVPLAALPASDTHTVLETITPAYPQFIDGGDTLETGINNIGAIFHPAISLLNAGWIESQEDEFQFYVDGVSQTVARIMEVLDRERVTIANAVGIRATTVLEWLKNSYNADGKDLYEAIQNQSSYQGIYAPTTLAHRYITEDIPMSLVPMASLGKRYGVSVRGIESMINLAGFAHQKNYWRCGRTMEKLGIENLGVSELKTFFQGRSPTPIQSIPDRSTFLYSYP